MFVVLHYAGRQKKLHAPNMAHGPQDCLLLPRGQQHICGVHVVGDNMEAMHNMLFPSQSRIHGRGARRAPPQRL